MSRSSYIYVVFDWKGSLMGAFTVKHELASALSGIDRHILDTITVVRTRDGYLMPNSQCVELDVQTLEPRP